jgi:hypothetical protein
MSVEWDASELDDLGELFSTTVARVSRERATRLASHAEAIRSQAATEAAGYRHATGALAEDLRVTGGDVTKRVGSSLREAFFLEFGSPTTGSPRPYLTGPARKEVDALLRELGEAAMPK